MQYRKIIISSLVLIVTGVGGLAYLFLETQPTLGPRWFFFFFLFIAVSGLALPFVAFLNVRFQGDRTAEAQVIVREAIFLGILVDLLAWLQMGRELTSTNGLLIAAAFILIEALLRISERGRWKPKASDD